jgi:hypothetical protein
MQAAPFYCARVRVHARLSRGHARAGLGRRRLPRATGSARSRLRTLAARQLLAEPCATSFCMHCRSARLGPKASLWLREGLVEAWSEAGPAKAHTAARAHHRRGSALSRTPQAKQNPKPRIAPPRGTPRNCSPLRPRAGARLAALRPSRRSRRRSRAAVAARSSPTGRSPGPGTSASRAAPLRVPRARESSQQHRGPRQQQNPARHRQQIRSSQFQAHGPTWCATVPCGSPLKKRLGSERP